LQNNGNLSKNAFYDQNLKDAFKNFRAGMEDLDLTLKFKYLFVALEKGTNINGEFREGKHFDNAVGGLYAVLSSDVENWRCFYNRIKHVQKDPNDLKRYYQGQEKLPDTLPEIRKCVQSILLSRLN
jgi:hypothetical protein